MKSYVLMGRINMIYQLELYQIRHFAAVAETGSSTKAATSLRTETSDKTILCIALSNERVRTRDDRWNSFTPTFSFSLAIEAERAGCAAFVKLPASATAAKSDLVEFRVINIVYPIYQNMRFQLCLAKD